MFLVVETIGARSYSTGHIEQEEDKITLLKNKKDKTNRLFKKGNKYKDEYVLFAVEKKQLQNNPYELYKMKQTNITLPINYALISLDKISLSKYE